MTNNTKTKNNKLPPNINIEKPSKMLNKYLLTTIKTQVRVKPHIINIYNGFLNKPLSPAINGIDYPLIDYNKLEVIHSNLL
jgi:hypothetical protein